MSDIKSAFNLGDKVVLMDGSDMLHGHHKCKRIPRFEGTVTACGEDCVRVSRFVRGVFGGLKNVEEWFSTIHESYHLTKVREF